MVVQDHRFRRLLLSPFYVATMNKCSSIYQKSVCVEKDRLDCVVIALAALKLQRMLLLFIYSIHPNGREKSVSEKR